MNIQELQLVAGVILKLGETGYTAFLFWILLQALTPILWFVGIVTCSILVTKTIVRINCQSDLEVVIRDALYPDEIGTTVSDWESKKVSLWIRDGLSNVNAEKVSE